MSICLPGDIGWVTMSHGRDQSFPGDVVHHCAVSLSHHLSCVCVCFLCLRLHSCSCEDKFVQERGVAGGCGRL